MAESETAYLAFNPKTGALLAWGKSAFHAVLAADVYSPSEPVMVFPAEYIGELAGARRQLHSLRDWVLEALQALGAL